MFNEVPAKLTYFIFIRNNKYIKIIVLNMLKSLDLVVKLGEKLREFNLFLLCVFFIKIHVLKCCF